MSTARYPEIRLNHDGTVDEVVAHKARVHLEQMDTGLWFLHVSVGKLTITVLR